MKNQNLYERAEIIVWDSIIKLGQNLESTESSNSMNPAREQERNQNHSSLLVQMITVALIGLLLGLASGIVISVIF